MKVELIPKRYLGSMVKNRNVSMVQVPRTKRKSRGIIGLLIISFMFFTMTLSPGETSNSIGEAIHSTLRSLSIDLGGGTCEWQPPRYFIPEDEQWDKTLIVGFPSGDKRLVFLQMEALTGWTTEDEWAFTIGNLTNHPFIKSNYPHYDGCWSWGDAIDKVVLVVSYIRKTLVEFHDIMWDLGFPSNYEEALLNEDNLFSSVPPKHFFYAWRDSQAMLDIHMYGWFIDFWMEGGLLRDWNTKELVTARHWYLTQSPDFFHQHADGDDYTEVVGDNPDNIPAYDQRCALITSGCEPVEVISADRLQDPSKGYIENLKIGKILQGLKGISNFLVPESIWDCLWDELYILKKGHKTFLDRVGLESREYNFSEEFLTEMIDEINHLVNKYSSDEWSSKETAKSLVSMLKDHKLGLQEEIVEVKAGIRILREEDFLGPETRKALKEKNMKENPSEVRDLLAPNDEEYDDFFKALDKKMVDARILMKKKVVRDELERRRRLIQDS